MGLVSQVFTGEVLHDLVGPMAVGTLATRPPGASQLSNAQPLTVDCARGQIAIAHNGNLTNAGSPPARNWRRAARFSRRTVDSEIILHLMAQPIVNGEANNLVRTMRRIEGAYSLVIMTDNELIGVRDPFGFRPLCIGKIDDAWVLSSESCALDLIHAKFVRDVEPGEIVIINENGLTSMQAFPEHQRRAFWHFRVRLFSLARQHHFKPECIQGPRRDGPAIGARISHLGRRGRGPCPTAAIAPRWDIPSRPGSPTKWRSCATITSGAAFCSRHN